MAHGNILSPTKPYSSISLTPFQQLPCFSLRSTHTRLEPQNLDSLDGSGAVTTNFEYLSGEILRILAYDLSKENLWVLNPLLR